MLSIAPKAVSSWKRYGSRSCDYSLVQLAKKQIKLSGYRVLRNDRDGGFCLVESYVVDQLQNFVVGNGNYVPVARTSDDFDRMLGSKSSQLEVPT